MVVAKWRADLCVEGVAAASRLAIKTLLVCVGLLLTFWSLIGYLEDCRMLFAVWLEVFLKM